MNTLQRFILAVIFSGSLAFAQTATKLPVEANAAASTALFPATPTVQNHEVLLASNASLTDVAGATSIPGNLLVKPVLVARKPTRQEVSVRQREAFYSLMAAEHGAALLDAWSTRDVLRAGGRELDPLVRPFAHGPGLYPALQVTPFAVDYFAAKMLRSNHAVLRKLWWVPQAVATSGSVYCGVTNLGNRP
jgi:hypothetical protein